MHEHNYCDNQMEYIQYETVRLRKKRSKLKEQLQSSTQTVEVSITQNDVFGFVHLVAEH